MQNEVQHEEQKPILRDHLNYASIGLILNRRSGGPLHSGSEGFIMAEAEWGAQSGPPGNYLSAPVTPPCQCAG